MGLCESLKSILQIVLALACSGTIEVELVVIGQESELILRIPKDWYISGMFDKFKYSNPFSCKHVVRELARVQGEN